MIVKKYGLKKNNMKYPEIGKYYKHYKGGLYRVMFLSEHTETGEVLVNYQSIHFGSYYSRPLDEWNKDAVPESTSTLAKVCTRFVLVDKP